MSRRRSGRIPMQFGHGRRGKKFGTSKHRKARIQRFAAKHPESKKIGQ